MSRKQIFGSIGMAAQASPNPVPGGSGGSLQTPLGSQKALSGSPRDSLKNLEEF